MKFRVGILTVSDRCSRGEERDRSGPLIGKIITERMEAEVTRISVVPDERDQIAATLRAWCAEGLDLIFTTGGTGFAPRDVTPEATRQVIERETPGLVEAVRNAGLAHTPRAMLSRATAGIRGQTLIINLPGSPGAVRDGLETLLPALPHGLAILKGVPEPYDHNEEEHRCG